MQVHPDASASPDAVEGSPHSARVEATSLHVDSTDELLTPKTPQVARAQEEQDSPSDGVAGAAESEAVPDFVSLIPTNFAQQQRHSRHHRKTGPTSRRRSTLHGALLPQEMLESTPGAHHVPGFLSAEMTTNMTSDDNTLDINNTLFELSDSILPHVLKQQRAPMLVVPYDEWKKADHIPRSSEKLTRPVRKSESLSADGIEDDLVVFITHRWWNPADNHPDDEDGSKYRIICKALEALIQTLGVDETTSVVIWIDYACIDQDDHELQSRGIASLISYAARADVVVTPVQAEPEAIEKFSTAEHPADLINYGERAWCRLETYMFLCVSEILMRPIHLYGYGMARPKADTVSCSCFFKPKPKDPEWTLKRLTATNDEGANSIEQQILNAREHVPQKNAHGFRKSASFKLAENSTQLKTTGSSGNSYGTTISKIKGSLIRSDTFDTEKAGIAYANSQLPSEGHLTVESDREVIRSIEQNLRNSYVHFAILYQCTLVSCMLQSDSKKKPIKFSMHGKQVRSKDLEMLQMHLQWMPFVSEICTLDLSHNLLDRNNIEQFFADVTDFKSCLKVLRLDGNPLFGSEGVVALQSFIESSSALTHLGLSQCLLDDRGMQMMSNMKFPSSFKKLDVSNNSLIGYRYLDRWIDNNKSKDIDFSGANLTSEQAVTLTFKLDRVPAF